MSFALTSTKNIEEINTDENYIDKYNMTHIDDAIENMNIIVKDYDEIVNVYINKEEPGFNDTRFVFKGNTKNLINKNENFINNYGKRIIPDDAGDDGDDNGEIIENEIIRSIQSFKYYETAVKKNENIRQRYVYLNNMISKKERLLLTGKKETAWYIPDTIKFLGFISGMSVFALKFIAISPLLSPQGWAINIFNMISTNLKNPKDITDLSFIDNYLSIFNLLGLCDLLTLKDLKDTFLKFVKDYQDNSFKFDNDFNKYLCKTIKDVFENNLDMTKKQLESRDLALFLIKIRELLINKNIIKLQDLKNIQIPGCDAGSTSSRGTSIPRISKSSGSGSSDKISADRNTFIKNVIDLVKSPITGQLFSSFRIGWTLYTFLEEKATFFKENPDVDPIVMFKGVTMNALDRYSPFGYVVHQSTNQIFKNIIEKININKFVYAIVGNIEENVKDKLNDVVKYVGSFISSDPDLNKIKPGEVFNWQNFFTGLKTIKATDIDSDCKDWLIKLNHFPTSIDIKDIKDDTIRTKYFNCLKKLGISFEETFFMSRAKDLGTGIVRENVEINDNTIWNDYLKNYTETLNCEFVKNWLAATVQKGMPTKAQFDNFKMSNATNVNINECFNNLGLSIKDSGAWNYAYFFDTWKDIKSYELKQQATEQKNVLEKLESIKTEIELNPKLGDKFSWSNYPFSQNSVGGECDSLLTKFKALKNIPTYEQFLQIITINSSTPDDKDVTKTISNDTLIKCFKESGISLTLPQNSLINFDNNINFENNSFNWESYINELKKNPLFDGYVKTEKTDVIEGVDKFLINLGTKPPSVDDINRLGNLLNLSSDQTYKILKKYGINYVEKQNYSFVFDNNYVSLMNIKEKGMAQKWLEGQGMDFDGLVSVSLSSMFMSTIKKPVESFFVEKEKNIKNLDNKEKNKNTIDKNKLKEYNEENINEFIHDMKLRGERIQTLKNGGYSDEFISDLYYKEKTPKTNDYKFFLFKYVKDFSNWFKDVIDDPTLFLQIFVDYTFIYQLITNNFWSILSGGLIFSLPNLILSDRFGPDMYKNINLISIPKILGDYKYDIVPVNLIITYFKFVFQVNDNIIDNTFEMFKMRSIELIMHDINLFINEIQSWYNESYIGINVNKYLTRFDNIVFKFISTLTKGLFNIAIMKYNGNIRTNITNMITSIPRINKIFATITDKEKGPIILAFLYDQMKNFFKLYIKNNDMKKTDYDEAVKEFQKQFSNIEGILNKRFEQSPYEYNNGQITLNIWNKPYSLSGKPFIYYEIDPITKEYKTVDKNNGKPFSILDKNNYVMVTEADSESIIQYVELNDIMTRFDKFVLTSDKKAGIYSLNKYLNFDIGTINEILGISVSETIEDRDVNADKYITDKLFSYNERTWSQAVTSIVKKDVRYNNNDLLNGFDFKFLCDNLEGFAKREGNPECQQDAAVEDFKYFIDKNVRFKDILFMLDKLKWEGKKMSFLELKDNVASGEFERLINKEDIHYYNNKLIEELQQYNERGWFSGKSSNKNLLYKFDNIFLCKNIDGFGKRNGNDECTREAIIEDFKFLMDNNISYVKIKYMLDNLPENKNGVKDTITFDKLKSLIKLNNFKKTVKDKSISGELTMNDMFYHIYYQQFINKEKYGKMSSLNSSNKNDFIIFLRKEIGRLSKIDTKEAKLEMGILEIVSRSINDRINEGQQTVVVDTFVAKFMKDIIFGIKQNDKDQTYEVNKDFMDDYPMLREIVTSMNNDFLASKKSSIDSVSEEAQKPTEEAQTPTPEEKNKSNANVYLNQFGMFKDVNIMELMTPNYVLPYKLVHNWGTRDMDVTIANYINWKDFLKYIDINNYNDTLDVSKMFEQMCGGVDSSECQNLNAVISQQISELTTNYNTLNSIIKNVLIKSENKNFVLNFEDYGFDNNEYYKLVTKFLKDGDNKLIDSMAENKYFYFMIKDILGLEKKCIIDGKTTFINSKFTGSTNSCTDIKAEDMKENFDELKRLFLGDVGNMPKLMRHIMGPDYTEKFITNEKIQEYVSKLYTDQKSWFSTLFGDENEKEMSVGFGNFLKQMFQTFILGNNFDMNKIKESCQNPEYKYFCENTVSNLNDKNTQIHTFDIILAIILKQKNEFKPILEVKVDDYDPNNKTCRVQFEKKIFNLNNCTLTTYKGEDGMNYASIDHTVLYPHSNLQTLFDFGKFFKTQKLQFRYSDTKKIYFDFFSKESNYLNYFQTHSNQEQTKFDKLVNDYIQSCNSSNNIENAYTELKKELDNINAESKIITYGNNKGELLVEQIITEGYKTDPLKLAKDNVNNLLMQTEKIGSWSEAMSKIQSFPQNSDKCDKGLIDRFKIIGDKYKELNALKFNLLREYLLRDTSLIFSDILKNVQLYSDNVVITLNNINSMIINAWNMGAGKDQIIIPEMSTITSTTEDKKDKMRSQKGISNVGDDKGDDDANSGERIIYGHSLKSEFWKKHIENINNHRIKGDEEVAILDNQFILKNTGIEENNNSPLVSVVPGITDDYLCKIFIKILCETENTDEFKNALCKKKLSCDSFYDKQEILMWWDNMIASNTNDNLPIVFSDIVSMYGVTKFREFNLKKIEAEETKIGQLHSSLQEYFTDFENYKLENKKFFDSFKETTKLGEPLDDKINMEEASMYLQVLQKLEESHKEQFEKLFNLVQNPNLKSLKDEYDELNNVMQNAINESRINIYEKIMENMSDDFIKSCIPSNEEKSILVLKPEDYQTIEYFTAINKCSDFITHYKNEFTPEKFPGLTLDQNEIIINFLDYLSIIKREKLDNDDEYINLLKKLEEANNMFKSQNQLANVNIVVNDIIKPKSQTEQNKPFTNFNNKLSEFEANLNELITNIDSIDNEINGIDFKSQYRILLENAKLTKDEIAIYIQKINGFDDLKNGINLLSEQIFDVNEKDGFNVKTSLMNIDELKLKLLELLKELNSLRVIKLKDKETNEFMNDIIEYEIYRVNFMKKVLELEQKKIDFVSYVEEEKNIITTWDNLNDIDNKKEDLQVYIYQKMSEINDFSQTIYFPSKFKPYTDELNTMKTNLNDFVENTKTGLYKDIENQELNIIMNQLGVTGDSKENYVNKLNEKYNQRLNETDTKVLANREYSEDLKNYLTEIERRLENMSQGIQYNNGKFDLTAKIEEIKKREKERYNVIESPSIQYIKQFPPTNFEIIDENAVFKYKDKIKETLFNVDESIIPGVPNNYLSSVCKQFNGDQRFKQLCFSVDDDSIYNLLLNRWPSIASDVKQNYIDEFRKEYKTVILNELNGLGNDTIKTEIFTKLPKEFKQKLKQDDNAKYIKEKTDIESYFDKIIKDITDISTVNEDNCDNNLSELSADEKNECDILNKLKDQKIYALDFLERQYDNVNIINELKKYGFIKSYNYMIDKKITHFKIDFLQIEEIDDDKILIIEQAIEKLKNNLDLDNEYLKKINKRNDLFGFNNTDLFLLEKYLEDLNIVNNFKKEYGYKDIVGEQNLININDIIPSYVDDSLFEKLYKIEAKLSEFNEEKKAFESLFKKCEKTDRSFCHILSSLIKYVDYNLIILQEKQLKIEMINILKDDASQVMSEIFDMPYRDSNYFNYYKNEPILPNYMYFKKHDNIMSKIDKFNSIVTEFESFIKNDMTGEDKLTDNDLSIFDPAYYREKEQYFRTTEEERYKNQMDEIIQRATDIIKAAEEKKRKKEEMTMWINNARTIKNANQREKIINAFFVNDNAITIEEVAEKITNDWDINDTWLLNLGLDMMSINDLLLAMFQKKLLSNDYITARTTEVNKRKDIMTEWIKNNAPLIPEANQKRIINILLNSSGNTPTIERLASKIQPADEKKWDISDTLMLSLKLDPFTINELISGMAKENLLTPDYIAKRKQFSETTKMTKWLKENARKLIFQAEQITNVFYNIGNVETIEQIARKIQPDNKDEQKWDTNDTWLLSLGLDQSTIEVIVSALAQKNLLSNNYIEKRRFNKIEVAASKGDLFSKNLLKIEIEKKIAAEKAATARLKAAEEKVEKERLEASEKAEKERLKAVEQAKTKQENAEKAETERLAKIEANRLSDDKALKVEEMRVELTIKSDEELREELNVNYGVKINVGTQFMTPQEVSMKVMYGLKTKPLKVLKDDYQLKDLSSQEESTDMKEKKKEITDTYSLCKNTKKQLGWHVESNIIDNDNPYKIVNGQEKTEENCIKQNLLHDLSVNVNKFIINVAQTIGSIAPWLASLVCAITASGAWMYTSKLCVSFSMLAWAIKKYGDCLIYIFHSAMRRKFSHYSFREKITDKTNSHLSEKVQFAIWKQMIVTLKDAEGKTNNRDSCDKTLRNITYGLLGGTFNNLEKDSVALINGLKSSFYTVQNSQYVNNVGQGNLHGFIDLANQASDFGYSQTNLEGIQDIGIIEMGINTVASFLTQKEQEQYTQFFIEFKKQQDNKKEQNIDTKKELLCMNIFDIKTKLQINNETTFLKYAIYSYFANNNDEILTTYLKCLFTNNKNPNFNFYKKSPYEKEIDWENIISYSVFFDWKGFISKISAIFITNDGVKEWFLTQVLGSKSHGKDVNFVRDLIDNALSIMSITIPKEEQADYVSTSILDAVNKIIDELTTVFGILRGQDAAYGNEKFHKEIYLRYVKAKNDNRSIIEMKGILQDAITFVNSHNLPVGEIDPLPDENEETYLENILPHYSVNKNVKYISDVAREGSVSPDVISNQISMEFTDIIQYYKFMAESQDVVVKTIRQNLENDPVGAHLQAFNNGEGIQEVYYPCLDENQVMYFYKKKIEGKNGNYLKEDIRCTNYKESDKENYNNKIRILESMYSKPVQKSIEEYIKDFTGQKPIDVGEITSIALISEFSKIYNKMNDSSTSATEKSVAMEQLAFLYIKIFNITSSPHIIELMRRFSSDRLNIPEETLKTLFMIDGTKFYFEDTSINSNYNLINDLLIKNNSLSKQFRDSVLKYLEFESFKNPMSQIKYKPKINNNNDLYLNKGVDNAPQTALRELPYDVSSLEGKRKMFRNLLNPEVFTKYLITNVLDKASSTLNEAFEQVKKNQIKLEQDVGKAEANLKNAVDKQNLNSNNPKSPLYNKYTAYQSALKEGASKLQNNNAFQKKYSNELLKQITREEEKVEKYYNEKIKPLETAEDKAKQKMISARRNLYTSLENNFNNKLYTKESLKHSLEESKKNENKNINDALIKIGPVNDLELKNVEIKFESNYLDADPGTSSELWHYDIESSQLDELLNNDDGMKLITLLMKDDSSFMKLLNETQRANSDIIDLKSIAENYYKYLATTETVFKIDDCKGGMIESVQFFGLSRKCPTHIITINNVNYEMTFDEAKQIRNDYKNKFRTFLLNQIRKYNPKNKNNTKLSFFDVISNMFIPNSTLNNAFTSVSGVKKLLDSQDYTARIEAQSWILWFRKNCEPGKDDCLLSSLDESALNDDLKLSRDEYIASIQNLETAIKNKNNGNIVIDPELKLSYYQMINHLLPHLKNVYAQTHSLPDKKEDEEKGWIYTSHNSNPIDYDELLYINELGKYSINEDFWENCIIFYDKQEMATQDKTEQKRFLYGCPSIDKERLKSDLNKISPSGQTRVNLEGRNNLFDIKPYFIRDKNGNIDYFYHFRFYSVDDMDANLKGYFKKFNPNYNFNVLYDSDISEYVNNRNNLITAQNKIAETKDEFDFEVKTLKGEVKKAYDDLEEAKSKQRVGRDNILKVKKSIGPNNIIIDKLRPEAEDAILNTLYYTMSSVRETNGLRVATSKNGQSIQRTLSKPIDSINVYGLFGEEEKKITVNNKIYSVTQDRMTEPEMTHTGFPSIIFGDWKKKQEELIQEQFGNLNSDDGNKLIISDYYQCALKHSTIDDFLKDINSVTGICNNRGNFDLSFFSFSKPETWQMFYYRVQAIKIMEEQLIPELYECKNYIRQNGIDTYKIPICVTKLQLSEYENNFVNFNKNAFFQAVGEHMIDRDAVSWNWYFPLWEGGPYPGLGFDYFQNLKLKSAVLYDITLTEELKNVQINVLNADKWLNKFLGNCKNQQPTGVRLLECMGNNDPLNRYKKTADLKTIPSGELLYIYDKEKYKSVDDLSWYQLLAKRNVANNNDYEARINGPIIYEPGTMNCAGYSVWEGEKVNLKNKPDGIGIFTCYEKSDKSKIKSEYKGNFKDGVMQGYGQMTEYIDGKKIIYKGLFSNNEKVGLGVLEFYEGSYLPQFKYVGYFKNNLINGYGKIIKGDAEFYCKFVDGNCSYGSEYSKIESISRPSTREYEFDAKREKTRRSWFLTKKSKSSNGRTCTYTFNNIEFLPLSYNKNIPYLKSFFNNWKSFEYEGLCDDYDYMKIYDENQNINDQDCFYKLNFKDKESNGVTVGEIPDSIRSNFLAKIPFSLYQKNAYDGVVFNPVNNNKKVVLDFEPIK